MKRRLLIQWDSTNRCNLRCSHCYHNSEGNSSHQIDDDEMSLTDVSLMLEDLVQTSQRWGMNPQFNLSGGDPLMRRDLYDVLKISLAHGIKTKLLTNGTLITPQVARDLRSLGIDALQISLDGTKQRHNAIRGFDFAYDKAIEGIINSTAAGIDVDISMTALKSNVDDFEDVIVSSANAGARYVGFQSYVPNPELGSNDSEFMNAQETYELFKKTQDLTVKYQDRITVMQTEVLWQILEDDNPIKQRSREDLKHLSGCSAGYFALSVLSDGTVYPCRRMPIEIGHITDGIQKIITESPVMQDLRDIQKLKEKSNCDYVTHCRGCRAVAYSVTGSYHEKDPMCFKDLVQIST